MAKYSKYIGVSFDKKKGKWLASIKNNGKCKFLGYAATEEDAYKKRLAAEEIMKDFLSKNILAQKKKDIIERYQSGQTVSEVASIFQLDVSTIYEHLHKSGIDMRDDRTIERDSELIISLYQSGKSASQIAQEIKCSSGVVLKRIKEIGAIRPIRKYFFKDEHFLKKIDKEWKAYFLGILWADGNMRTLGGENNKSSSVNIVLKESDAYLLRQLAQEIFSNEIKFHIRPSTRYFDNKTQKEYWSKPSWKLVINSKIIYEDLLNLGCHPKKSSTIKMPEIPSEHFHHFVRGYFDGDGWVAAKNNTFGMIGSYAFCEQIQQKLENQIELKSSLRDCGKVCRLLSWNFKNMQKFYDFIYKDATIFMSRKKERFDGLLASRK